MNFRYSRIGKFEFSKGIQNTITCYAYRVAFFKPLEMGHSDRFVAHLFIGKIVEELDKISAARASFLKIILMP